MERICFRPAEYLRFSCSSSFFVSECDDEVQVYSVCSYVLELCSYGNLSWNAFNPLAPEQDIYSLAHHLCKM